ncbi:MAG: F0F1 ATP synthase subunit B [Firmicutes bacterium]|nr:F0F1 ATP synthase subunit B [Bacillota bacterium]
MQSLEVISINLWQILISLANLVILFLIVKKFLFKPVKKVLAQRQDVMDAQYSAAQEAQAQALADKDAWEHKMQSAKAEADAIMKDAASKAQIRGDRIVSDAREKADGIIRQAQTAAELERKKAEDGIKKEIVDVSAALTEKMLGREINAQDHREMIDSFIEGLGEDDGSDE